MVYPSFAVPSGDHEVDENEASSSSERTSLLDTTISVFRLPAEAAASRSRISHFLGSGNAASYGSIAADRHNNNYNYNYNYDRDNRDVIRTLNNGNEDDSLSGDDETNIGEERADFADIEEGTNRQRSHSDPLPRVETVDSNSNRNANPNNRERHHHQQQQQQQQSTNETPRSEEEEQQQIPRDGAIGNITRRLRCVFSTITFPIVPLGTVVSLALLWVLYAATSLDLRKNCSHPLHSFAFMSLLLVAYIPNHSQVRSQIFNYSRERDGSVRPTRVRMYDQFFHTICLLYVYTGATLIQTCKEDLVDPNSDTAHENFEKEQHGDAFNTCEATCPNLYQAMSVYVATLELFTFALILPLLFLPCIYLWFLQRASAEADAFARLQDRLQEEDALLSNGGVTTGEILDSLDVVKIVSRQQPPPKKDTKPETETSDGNESILDDDSELTQLWIVPRDADPNEKNIGTKCETKECCICMSEFHVEIIPEEDNIIVPSTSTLLSSSSDSGKKYSDLDETIPLIQTTASKVLEDSDSSSSCTIVRTKCGHLFHKECLKGWVGGMWSANSNGNFRGDIQQQDWRKRKARQIYCPLCREDLRPCANS